MATEVTAAHTLSPGQHKAIEALLITGNVTEAARAAGVARKTVYAWLKQPAFAKALREGEGIALESLTRSLRALGDKAVEALAAVFDDPEATHATKLKAASIVFSHHPQYLQSIDLTERLAALEAALEGRG
jgi:hypothetical protein